MDHKPQTCWAKHLIRAAIDYFTERHARACIVVDNGILSDGVLKSVGREGDSDFIICVAPGFTTQMDYGPEELTIAVRFDACHHVMTIPYSAIRYVIAANAGGPLTDGHLNLISVPPVVFNPSTLRRRSTDNTSLVIDDEEMMKKLAAQPAQEELQLVRAQR